MKRVIPPISHCYECPYRVQEQWSQRFYCTHTDAWKPEGMPRCLPRGTARGISEMDDASAFPTWCPLDEEKQP